MSAFTYRLNVNWSVYTFLPSGSAIKMNSYYGYPVILYISVKKNNRKFQYLGLLGRNEITLINTNSLYKVTTNSLYICIVILLFIKLNNSPYTNKQTSVMFTGTLECSQCSCRCIICPFIRFSRILYFCIVGNKIEINTVRILK